MNLLPVYPSTYRFFTEKVSGKGFGTLYTDQAPVAGNPDPFIPLPLEAPIVQNYVNQWFVQLRSFNHYQSDHPKEFNWVRKNLEPRLYSLGLTALSAGAITADTIIGLFAAVGDCCPLVAFVFPSRLGREMDKITPPKQNSIKQVVSTFFNRLQHLEEENYGRAYPSGKKLHQFTQRQLSFLKLDRLEQALYLLAAQVDAAIHAEKRYVIAEYNYAVSYVNLLREIMSAVFKAVLYKSGIDPDLEPAKGLEAFAATFPDNKEAVVLLYKLTSSIFDSLLSRFGGLKDIQQELISDMREQLFYSDLINKVMLFLVSAAVLKQGCYALVRIALEAIRQLVLISMLTVAAAVERTAHKIVELANLAIIVLPGMIGAIALQAFFPEKVWAQKSRAWMVNAAADLKCGTLFFNLTNVFSPRLHTFEQEVVVFDGHSINKDGSTIPLMF